MTRLSTWRPAVLALVFVLSRIAPAAAQNHDHHQAHGGATPLYDNLGDHARDVTGNVEGAIAYFNQGLRLQYAFNHAEAIRSYQAALRLDPDCAMCYWGIALASGPNINAAMDDEGGRKAFHSVREAVNRLEGANDVERALIGALAARYGKDPSADRVALDSAYAGAMALVADQFPDDSDVLTLYAAARMNLSPWNYWSGDYENRLPNPGTEDILRALERALVLDPDNPGACHYYIHAVEAAYPEKAEACADRLPELMPGAGHIVHMPGHVYIRVGRYLDAVHANDHAVHSDETYIADQSPMGIYPAAYYPHNYHFMAFAASMAGMSEKAMEAARIVAPKVPHEVALEVYWIQNAVVLPQLTAVTFGRWDEILSLEMPASDLYHARAMDLYARGVAHAALGDLEAAADALGQIGSVAREGDPDEENPTFSIAAHALQGEIALRSGDAGGAVDHFTAAVAIEDGMLYEEPPLWYYPIRHSLGRALIEAGRAEEAEAAYRRDLARFRENGWSLFGLATALDDQGKTAEAGTTWARFEKAWQHADVKLTASRF